MEGQGLRIASRIPLACLLATVCLFTAGLPASASSDPLTITAQYGYNNIVKAGQWMPVQVNVTNNGAAFDGTLQIATPGGLPGKGGPSASGAVLYQTPLSLAAGASKRLRTYVVQDQPAAITVQVVQSGRVVISRPASAGNVLSVLVGVVSDQAATLSALASSSPLGLTVGVVHLAAADLSNSAVVLRAFDLIAIDDFSTDTLTAGQRAALVDYVTNGGALLLGTGSSWHKTVAGLPPEIVPMQIASSGLIVASKTLAGAFALDIVTGTVAPGATAWLAEGSQPLIVEKPVGEGFVTLAAFDWGQDPIASWPGTPALLRQVLVRSAPGLEASSNNGAFFGPGVSVAARGGSVSQVLGNLPSLSLPTWWLIGALILLYVLLVGPINYFVLRALNRRALAWLTIPAIVLVASGGAYGASVATKGRSVQANEVSILHMTQDSDRAYAEVYTGILTPTRGDYHVGIGGSRPMISPIYNYSAPTANTGSVTMSVDTTDDGITLPGMTAFTLRGFATEDFVAAPSLVVQAQLLNGQVVGTVNNTSTTAFTDGVVIAGNSFQKFGALAPGVSAAFQLTPSIASPFTGPPAYMTIYPSFMFGQGAPPTSMTDAEREAETKTAILSTLSSNGALGASGSAAPTVVVWSKQAIHDITVDGSPPRLFAESAIVTTAPVGGIGRGTLPAGVAVGRVVDIDGSLQPGGGPPGVLMLQSGTVTYEFAPQLAEGVHLRTASISILNQFGFKGGPAGPSSGSAKAEVWDWSQNAWIEVNLQNPGTTSIPPAAVKPSTGEVRLRVGASGGFFAGWPSLVGDVE
jgi:hypothetical protein